MADSDSEHGSDAGGEDGNQGGFDPTRDLEKLPDKERKKWDKRLKQWRLFMDFLFRHVSICTYKINAFERDDLSSFLVAMERAEQLRGQKKLKKKESPNISSYKLMKESTELLTQQKYLNEANRIRGLLNIAGRMRGLATIAGGFYKALKKGNIRGLDKIKHNLDFWKGFTIRSFDYSELTFQNADPGTFNSLERKYLVWPTVVKTALHLSQKFLKTTSEATGLDLIPPDLTSLKKYLEAPEFVLATNMEDQLFSRVQTETKSYLSGLGSALAGGLALSSESEKNYDLPNVEDVDPRLMKAIPDDAVLLNLPSEPPKEKKRKGKKGKKGKKGGRSHSASSHKGGKKKKKKK